MVLSPFNLLDIHIDCYFKVAPGYIKAALRHLFNPIKSQKYGFNFYVFLTKALDRQSPFGEDAVLYDALIILERFFVQKFEVEFWVFDELIKELKKVYPKADKWSEKQVWSLIGYLN